MKAIYDQPLPDGWSEEPLGKAVVTRRGYTWEKTDEVERAEADTVPVIRIPNVQDTLDLTDLIHLRDVSPEALEKAAVTKDWLLFVGSNGTQDRIGDSVLIEEDRPMVFASFLMGIQPKDQGRLRSDFFAHWMRMHLVHEVFSKTSQQTTGLANFSWGAVKKLPVRFPTCVDEQRRIAAALKLVDDAIQKARVKFDATRQLKRSVMTTLFESGLPATGDKVVTKTGPVPSRWKLRRGRDIFKLLGSKAGEPGAVSSDGDCHYLKVDDFNSFGNEKVIFDSKVKFCRAENPGYPVYAKGAIVFAKRGAALLKDRVRMLGTDSMIDPNLMAMECNESIVLTAFMYQYLVFFRLGRLCEDAGIPQLNNRDLYPRMFPVPELEEQLSIVSLIETAEAAEWKAAKELSALQELKLSLLQNLLTGKIRIPEGAIHA